MKRVWTRALSLLLSAIILLTASACGITEPAEPESADIRQDAQRYVENQLGAGAAISIFELQDQVREGRYLDVTAVGVIDSDGEKIEGTFSLSYSLSDGSWNLDRCKLDAETLNSTTEQESVPVVQAPEDPEEETQEEEETAPPVEDEKPAETEIEMSDDWKDFTFEMDGEQLRLPMPLTYFLERGWTIDRSYEDVGEEDLIGGYSSLHINLTDGAVTIWISVINMGGHAKAVRDCNVGSIKIEARDNLDVALANGITLQSSVEEIKEAYGAPSRMSTSGDYTYLYYEVSGSSTNKMTFTIHKDTRHNSVDLYNFIATEEDATEVSDERPAYLSEYQAPTSLANNTTYTQFCLDGKLYQLPCPLTEFTDAGWTITSSSAASLGAKNKASRALTLTKDNRRLYVGLMNFSDLEVYTENCAVYEVEFYDSNLKNASDDYLYFPAQLTLHSSLSTVAECCQQFELYRGSYFDQYHYTIYDDNNNRTLRIAYQWNHDGTRGVSIENLIWDY